MNSTPEPTGPTGEDGPVGFSQPSPYKPIEHSVFTPVEEIARGDRVKVNGVEREVTCVHLDERRGTVQVCLDNDWEPNFITTGIGVNIEQVVSHSGMDPRPFADDRPPLTPEQAEAVIETLKRRAETPADSNEVPESLAAGGWCAPSEAIYSFFPEITAPRGGLSFSYNFDPPKPIEELTKKELRGRLVRAEDRVEALQKLHRQERAARKKAERTTKRLLKIIKKVA